ncbi:MAG: DoxX family membrane protein [Phycisphaerales bacterium]
MRLRDQVALTLPTLFLRLTLGVVFLWAGSGKFLGTMSVSGESAARLANIGIMPMPVGADGIEGHDGLDTPTALPEEVPDAADASSATNPIEDRTTPPPSSPAESNDGSKPVDQGQVQPPLDEQAKDIIEQIKGTLGDPAKPNTKNEGEPTDPAGSLIPVQMTSKVYVAADFPEPGQVKQLYGISLLLTKAANPGLTADSQPIAPILPEMFGEGIWPMALAWAAAITEIAAGALLILGFLTRISAFGLLVVMLTAVWLTQIGPAAVQSGDALLGFLPRVDDPWNPGAYQSLLWTVSLAAMSASVMLLGSGAIGIDRILFRPKVRDPYLHGDPKASKPPRRAGGSDAQDRSEFDRTPNPTP